MIDALEWGEIISQAMGNPENSFSDTFGTLKSIQLTHATKSDVLATVYEKLYHEIFRDPNNEQKYNDQRWAGCIIFKYEDLQKRYSRIFRIQNYW